MSNKETTHSEPTEAATVIPVRDTEAGIEVYMLRRHSESTFMPDRYVYPGGKLEEGDTCDSVIDRFSDRDQVEKQHEFLIKKTGLRKALGILAAGIREAFEESGLFFGSSANSSSLASLDLQTEREKLLSENTPQTFLSTLEKNELLVDGFALHYFAHWVTPEAESHRYDTHFFVAKAPETQTAIEDEIETFDGTWLEAGEALRKNQEGNLQLAPPTRQTLLRITEYADTGDLLQSSREMKPPRLLPRLDPDSDQIRLIIPGDNEYFPDINLEENLRVSTEYPTRLVLVEPGKWQPISAEDF